MIQRFTLAAAVAIDRHDKRSRDLPREYTSPSTAKVTINELSTTHHQHQRSNDDAGKSENLAMFSLTTRRASMTCRQCDVEALNTDPTFSEVIELLVHLLFFNTYTVVKGELHWPAV